MEITQQKNGDILVIHLAGRLDASWCDPVEKALSEAVRSGEHRIHLDMEKVDYISSIGLRVLFGVYKQLLAIKGSFAILNPSPTVRSVLELVGIGSLIGGSEPPAAAAPTSEGRSESSARADYEIFPVQGTGMRLAVHGDESLLRSGTVVTTPVSSSFGPRTFAFGVGALGTNGDEGQCRIGEFLAVAGTAAFQPTDGSNRPDFAVSEGSFVPEGHLFLGLAGEGDFSLLARFEAKKEARSVGLTELAQAALDFTGAPAVAIAAITETSGLVGATLRKPPTASGTEERFGFPQIRDWLSFTNERAFRDSTSLIVGVAARGETPLHPLLRPLGQGVSGHFHAAAFPYRPLQKGFIDLQPSVAALYENHNLNAILHLLADPREFSGAGESEFLRGALWIAPLLS